MGIVACAREYRRYVMRHRIRERCVLTRVAVLFTVSNLIIADAFPGSFQSLAGGVFAEVTQLGNACGLAVTAAIAASVSDRQTQASGTELSLAEKREALMTGFRAVFWTVFAGTSIVAVVCSVGFRRGGIVGKKRD